MSKAIDVEALLQPIPGSNPAGDYLYTDPLYRQIDQVRSRNPDADWRFVVKSGVDLLTNRTKDLQIAVHVTEALGRLHGLDGLRQGFDLLTGLQDRFWPMLYPLPDGTDLEPRLTPYEFLDNTIPPILDVTIALTAAPSMENYNHQRFNHRSLTEAEKETRNDAVRRTNIAYHRQIAREFDTCRSAYDSCMKSLQQQVGASAPVFERLPVLLNGMADCLAIIERVRPFRTVEPAPAPMSKPVNVEPSSTTVDPIRFAGGTEVSSPEEPFQLAVDPSSSEPMVKVETSHGRKPIAVQAAELADSGRIDAAIQLLDRARQSSRCRRERFIHQLEMVEVCLYHRQSRLARPLLDELFEEMEARKIEEWEDPALCARVLSARLSCLKGSGSHEDAHQIPAIFQRLCRLDPRRALGQDDSGG